MMKFIMYVTKLILTAAVAMLFASCRFEGTFGPGVTGDGNVITESRDNDTDFTEIEVCCGLELEIGQSDKSSITVIADQNLQNHISTDINGGVLTIKSDVNIKNATSKKVIVTLPQINGLQASSGATIRSRKMIKGQNLDITSSSAGDVKISIEAENTTASSSSGSSIELEGKTLKLETDASSGSDIHAYELLANDVISDGSSGSVTKINPLVSLKAKASSGAEITYRKEPQNVSRRASSGGRIAKK